MTVSLILIVVAVLVAAVLCVAFGTLRGSWRVWLVGYALAVAALVLAYGAVWRAHMPSAPAGASARSTRADTPAGTARALPRPAARIPAEKADREGAAGNAGERR